MVLIRVIIAEGPSELQHNRSIRKSQTTNRKLYITEQTTRIHWMSSQISWTVKYSIFALLSESAHDVREESSDRNVTDELPEEEVPDGRVAHRTEGRKQEQQLTEAATNHRVTGRNGRRESRMLRAIFLQHHLRLVLQKFDSNAVAQSSRICYPKKCAL